MTVKTTGKLRPPCDSDGVHENVPVAGSSTDPAGSPIAENAKIVRIPFGPKRYLRKEALWPHLEAFIDQTLNHFRRTGLRPIGDDVGRYAADPTHLSDVVFLKAPLTSAQAMRAVSLREGVDRAWAGTGVLYLDRVAERSSQSRFSRLASTPHYRKMTIRNWSTTTRLLAMLDER